jgi:hypothetical protein
VAASTLAAVAAAAVAAVAAAVTRNSATTIGRGIGGDSWRAPRAQDCLWREPGQPFTAIDRGVAAVAPLRRGFQIEPP